MASERPYQVYSSLDRSLVTIRFVGNADVRVIQTVRTVYGMNGDYKSKDPLKTEKVKQ